MQGQLSQRSQHPQLNIVTWLLEDVLKAEALAVQLFKELQSCAAEFVAGLAADIASAVVQQVVAPLSGPSTSQHRQQVDVVKQWLIAPLTADARSWLESKPLRQFRDFGRSGHKLQPPIVKQRLQQIAEACVLRCLREVTRPAAHAGSKRSRPNRIAEQSAAMGALKAKLPDLLCKLQKMVAAELAARLNNCQTALKDELNSRSEEKTHSYVAARAPPTMCGGTILTTYVKAVKCATATTLCTCMPSCLQHCSCPCTWNEGNLYGMPVRRCLGGVRWLNAIDSN
jgi:hypothetical protein